MEVFVAVADAGGFANAGTRLRISAPATRAMSSLEERLGARLFNRTTRGLTLTEPGLEDVWNVREVADLPRASGLGDGRRLPPDASALDLIIPPRATTRRPALSRSGRR
jgi:hypothetical protein